MSGGAGAKRTRCGPGYVARTAGVLATLHGDWNFLASSRRSCHLQLPRRLTWITTQSPAGWCCDAGRSVSRLLLLGHRRV